MTLQQLRYAVEVEKTGSITKSAANLFMSQPSLSIALRDLEGEVGVSLFERTHTGVKPTAAGEDFLLYAKSVLSQMDKLEFIFKKPEKQAVALRMASIRSSYASHLFWEFYRSLPADMPVSLQFKETTVTGVLDAVAKSEADLGKIAFTQNDYAQYQALIHRRRLMMEVLWKVQTYILVPKQSPLAKLDIIPPEALSGYTRAWYKDFEDESHGPDSALFPDAGERVLFVNDRASMMDLLCECPDCYLITYSTHPQILRRYNLAAKPMGCPASVIEAIVYLREKPLTREMLWIIERYRALRYSEEFLFQEPFRGETIL